MEKIDTAVKQASQSGGVTQSYVDGIRDDLQSAITQLTTRVTNIESSISGLKNNFGKCSGYWHSGGRSNGRSV